MKPAQISPWKIIERAEESLTGRTRVRIESAATVTAAKRPPGLDNEAPNQYDNIKEFLNMNAKLDISATVLQVEKTDAVAASQS